MPNKLHVGQIWRMPFIRSRIFGLPVYYSEGTKNKTQIYTLLPVVLRGSDSWSLTSRTQAESTMLWKILRSHEDEDSCITRSFVTFTAGQILTEG